MQVPTVDELEFALNHAWGVHLDGLGEMFALPREPGETDECFSERLRWELIERWRLPEQASGRPPLGIVWVEEAPGPGWCWWERVVLVGCGSGLVGIGLAVAPIVPPVGLLAGFAGVAAVASGLRS